MTRLKGEIAIVGGGLAGRAAAIGFATQGFDTLLVAPPPAEDRRSTALIGASVAFLERLAILSRLQAEGEGLSTMRIVDDTGRLFRAPTVEFRAGEIDLPCFGYNVLNADLTAILADRATELSDRLQIVPRGAVGIATGDGMREIRLDDGTIIEASLVVGADGRGSIVREGAGIGLREWSYPQTALVLNFLHEQPHGGISTEFHTATGPFTQVPLPGRRSSLVWVERPETAALLVDLRPERLAAIIEEKMHSILGAVEVDGPVQTFPLRGAIATRMTADRLVLIGEAAHIFPPIGAQGLNLGLRDAVAIVDATMAARDDPGRRSVVRRFASNRQGDVLSRTAGVDALNRSLLTGFLPVQALRSLGLSAMAASPALRRLAMREGALPGAGLFGLPDRLRESFARNG